MRTLGAHDFLRWTLFFGDLIDLNNVNEDVKVATGMNHMSPKAELFKPVCSDDN